jgi:hypothetical protein
MMSAAASASASAALPQFEVKGRHGLQPLKAADHFTGKGGLVELKSGGPTITCAESTSKGKLIGPNTVASIKIAYKECAIPSLGVMCHSGKVPRELTPYKLKAELVYLGKAEAGGKVGLLYTPEQATPFMRFWCSSTEVTVMGSVIAEVTPINVLVTTGSAALAETPASEKEKCGKQLWQFVEGEGPCHHLEALGGPTWNIGTEVLTYQTAVQITS